MFSHLFMATMKLNLLQLLFEKGTSKPRALSSSLMKYSFVMSRKGLCSKGWTESYLGNSLQLSKLKNWKNSKERIFSQHYHLIFIWINFYLLQEFVSEFCSSETEKEVLIAMFDSTPLPPLSKLSAPGDWQDWMLHPCWQACMIYYARNRDIILPSRILLCTRLLCCLILP